MKRFLLIITILLSALAMDAQVLTFKGYAVAQKEAGYSWSKFKSTNLIIRIKLNTDVISINNEMGL